MDLNMSTEVLDAASKDLGLTVEEQGFALMDPSPSAGPESRAWPRETQARG